MYIIEHARDIWDSAMAVAASGQFINQLLVQIQNIHTNITQVIFLKRWHCCTYTNLMFPVGWTYVFCVLMKSSMICKTYFMMINLTHPDENNGTCSSPDGSCSEQMPSGCVLGRKGIRQNKG